MNLCYREVPRGLESHTSITVEGKEINVEARELVVLEELGRGAFGVVEKMKHTPSDTIMAVKVSRVLMLWIIIILYTRYIL